MPELRERAVRERLEAGTRPWLATPRSGTAAQASLDLVVTASTGRFDEAWSGYERTLPELSQHYLGPRLMALLDQLRAEERAHAERTVELGEEVLAQLHWSGRSGGRVDTLLRTAAAYYSAKGSDLEDRLERGIALCQGALDVVAAGIDDEGDPKVIEEWHMQSARLPLCRVRPPASRGPGGQPRALVRGRPPGARPGEHRGQCARPRRRQLLRQCRGKPTGRRWWRGLRGRWRGRGYLGRRRWRRRATDARPRRRHRRMRLGSRLRDRQAQRLGKRGLRPRRSRRQPETEVARQRP